MDFVASRDLKILNKENLKAILQNLKVLLTESSILIMALESILKVKFYNSV